MFNLIFTDHKSGRVTYAVSEVTLVRYITPSEVGFTDRFGHIRASSFTQAEDLKVERIRP